MTNPAGPPLPIDSFPTDDLELDAAVSIDIEAIDTDSKESAQEMIKTITDLYHDEKFMAAHPQVKRRIDLELETLRGLIKMRIADETAHDAILSAIASNKNNASMYRSLSEIQKTSLAITTKIHDTIEKINGFMKGYQLELPFDENKDEETETESKPTKVHRGSKDFIASMLEDES